MAFGAGSTSLVWFFVVAKPAHPTSWVRIFSLLCSKWDPCLLVTQGKTSL
jgi:hypothetical protein